MECCDKKITRVQNLYTLLICSMVMMLLLSIPSKVNAQIFPKEGSKLHYRLVGFSFPRASETERYTLEIANGNYNSEDSFKGKVIISLTASENRLIAEVPSFGCQYTWRVISVANSVTTTKSELHHFSTNIIPNVDTNISRFRITKNTDKYKDAYVFLDGKRTLNDINGHPIWYLPALPAFNNENLRDLRDLKLSPQGTITFLLNEQAYEINYNGDILWKGPNNGVVSGKIFERYHHEFTRLANGHYMVLGSENVLWKLNPTKDTSLLHNDKIIRDSSNTIKQKIEFGTLIEYDEKGNVVWRWKSSEYFKGSDLSHRKTANGMFDIDTHENSFFYDEKAKVIYISFRNISSVLKIKYPEGKVLNTYGSIYMPHVTTNSNDLFCYQHSCRHSQNGYLYLFDNNSCNAGASPKIVIIQEPKSEKEKIKRVWEYECNVDGKPATIQEDDKLTRGGNVIELPDSSLFVSMCSKYSAVFIVNRDKKILWSGVPENWNQGQNKWNATIQYRASIINNRKDLENLIWNGISN